MRVQVLQVPYDSGRRDERMGRGPAHFLHHGAASRLRALGHAVDAETVEAPAWAARFATEIATSFAVYGVLAERVERAAAAGVLPVVLSGNCGSALGTVAGLRAARPAEGVSVVWLDAHGDFNTPETTGSGFLDGMALAALTGRCWVRMAATLPGFGPVPEERVATVGVRDLDALECEALARSRVNAVSVDDIRTWGAAVALGRALAAVGGEGRVYLHVDLDVLDPDAVGLANALAPAGGLTLAEAQAVVATVARSCTLGALCLASYDPACDEGAAVWQAGVALLETAVDAVAGAPVPDA
jgi:arginase